MGVAIGSAAQQNVKVTATIVDKEGFTDFPNLIIVNKNTGQSILGTTSGNFSLELSAADTILIGAIGYQTKKYFLPAGYSAPTLRDTILLSKLQFDLNTVTVFGERDLKEIHEELAQLEFDRSEYMLSGIDAMQSPITFLYQALSRREQQKRRAYEIILEDKRREVLKELFQKYVDAEIISLNKNEFDEFIDFCQISDRAMQSLSQYDFIMLVKARYSHYRNTKRYNLEGR